MTNVKSKNRTPKVRKKAHIRGLVQIKHEFREALEPLTKMLQERQARLKTASPQAVPYILDDIQSLSDAVTNTEAMFGKLYGYYAELGDAQLLTERKLRYAENQWRRCWNTITVLNSYLRKLGLGPEDNTKMIYDIKDLNYDLD